MKVRLVISIIILSCGLMCSANTVSDDKDFPQHPQKQTGEAVIDYSKVSPMFSPHVTAKTVRLSVTLANKYTGENVFYSDGLYIIHEDRGSDEWAHREYGWSIVDTTGVVLTRNLDMRSNLPIVPVFSKGKALSKGSKNYGIINKKGLLISKIDATLHSDAFVDGLALASSGSGRNRTLFYIGPDGNQKFPGLSQIIESYTNVKEIRHLVDDRRAYYDYSKSKWGYIDSKGVIVIPAKFEEAEDFSDGLACVCIKTDTGDKYGFIDKSGKFIIESRFSIHPGDFHDGKAVVQKRNGKYVLLSKDGSISTTEYSNIWPFLDGYALAETGFKKVLLNIKEDQVEVKGRLESFPGYMNSLRSHVRDNKNHFIVYAGGVFTPDLVPLLWGAEFEYLGDGLFWFAVTNNYRGADYAKFEHGVIRYDGEIMLLLEEPEF